MIDVVYFSPRALNKSFFYRNRLLKEGTVLQNGLVEKICKVINIWTIPFVQNFVKLNPDDLAFKLI